jgi:hypothetical protein
MERNHTMSPTTNQIAHQVDLFDLLTLEEPITAPLGFTTDTYSPDDLNKAADRWRAEHGVFGLWGKSHMWHCSNYDFGRNRTVAGKHPTVLMTADTRCDHYGPTRCSCIGDLLYRALCEGCGHATDIHATENAAVEEHLDHCWAGWRNLPTLTRTAQGEWKIPDDYPISWQVPGAPIRTLREPMGTRHVPSASPFGGYDAGTLTP